MPSPGHFQKRDLLHLAELGDVVNRQAAAEVRTKGGKRDQPHRLRRRPPKATRAVQKAPCRASGAQAGSVGAHRGRRMTE